LIVANLFETIE